MNSCESWLKNAKGNIDKLYLHWTGCAYGQVFDAYHINIDEHGEIYLTCNTLRDLKEHTWKRNSRAIGITLCCAKGAVLNYHWQPVYAGYPPTELQVEQMAIVIAILCRELELEISFTTVKTHAEVALLDGYGPGQDDPEMRWDLLRLSGLPETRVLRPGGELLRKKALAYSERLLSAQLLKQPEEEQQIKLLAA